MPDSLLKLLDEKCLQEHYDRSEFIRSCLRVELSATTDRDNVVVREMVDKIKEKKPPVEIKTTDEKAEVIKVETFEGEPTFNNFITQKQIKTCKHGYALGNCKFGCW